MIHAEIEHRLEQMSKSQDFGWYWASFGEKCYCFGVVTAFPLSKEDEDKTPLVCRLEPHPEKDRVWVTEDGVEMLIDDPIASIERQCGGRVCEFIAHAPTDIRALLEENKRLRSQIAYLELNQITA